MIEKLAFVEASAILFVFFRFNLLQVLRIRKLEHTHAESFSSCLLLLLSVEITYYIEEEHTIVCFAERNENLGSFYYAIRLLV